MMTRYFDYSRISKELSTAVQKENTISSSIISSHHRIMDGTFPPNPGSFPFCVFSFYPCRSLMVETGKKPQSREKGAPRSVLLVREGDSSSSCYVLFTRSLFILVGALMDETGKKPQSREKGVPRSALRLHEGAPCPGSKKEPFLRERLGFFSALRILLRMGRFPQTLVFSLFVLSLFILVGALMVETGKKPQSREKGVPRSVPWVREGSPFPGSKKGFSFSCRASSDDEIYR